MLQIENTLISLDIFDKFFCCDLQACKGVCCVEGDSGAPIEENEAKIIADIYPIIEPYLRKECIEVIKRDGTTIIDSDGDLVTPLIAENKECVYTVFEDGIAKCAIEKAYLDKKIDFRKPISCHLYPIRIKKLSMYDAVNYHQQKNCSPARNCGNKLNLAVYQFLKEPLIRKYGVEWYKQVKIAASEL